MTGPEHYAAAERLLSDASFTSQHGDAVRRDGGLFQPGEHAALIARAQVHATLALAATTAPTTAELTVYRASHESIVMGLYTTREAARAHCEADMRRDLPGVALDWIEDEDGEEEGVAELAAAVGEEEHTTGFVVTPLTVASEYDPEADA